MHKRGHNRTLLFIAQVIRFSQSFKNWDGKEDGMKSIDMLSLWNCEKIVSFYNLQLLEGEMVKPTETNKS